MKKTILTKVNLRKRITALALLLAATWGNTAMAQQKVNDGTVPATAINANAIAEYQTNNKGILQPRVALTATTAAAPLTAHVAGMKVYNTATAGTGATRVTPGEYYNDGSKWVRLAVASSSTLIYGSGAPSGACTEGLYTDTLQSSPTAGQQWTCSGGTWVSYNSPSQTEWYLSGGSNDAGSDKASSITRTGPFSVRSSITNPDREMLLMSDPALRSEMYFINKPATGSNTFSIRSGYSPTPGLSIMSLGGVTAPTVAMSLHIANNGNVGIGTATPTAGLEVNGSLKFPTAGTPVAGKVLMTDNAGNATWQATTGFGNTALTTTGTFTCPWTGVTGGIGSATGLSINIPSDGWYYFQSGISIQSLCNDYWMYVVTGSGNQDIFRVYCGAGTGTVMEYMVPRDQNRLVFITAGTYPILAGKTNGNVPNNCNEGNPGIYIKAVKVQN